MLGSSGSSRTMRPSRTGTVHRSTRRQYTRARADLRVRVHGVRVALRGARPEPRAGGDVPRVRSGEGAEAALDVRRARRSGRAVELASQPRAARRLLRRLLRLRLGRDLTRSDEPRHRGAKRPRFGLWPRTTGIRARGFRRGTSGRGVHWRPMDAVERAAALREYAEQTSLCTKCALAEADAGRLRLGEPERRPHVRRRGAGLPRGPAGRAVRRAGGEAPRQAPRRNRAHASGRLRGERLEVPAATTRRFSSGTGRWERIGRLVKRRYDGTVMSVDERGQLVPAARDGLACDARSPSGACTDSRTDRRRMPARARSATSADSRPSCLDRRGVCVRRGSRPGDRVATGQGLSRLALDVVCGTVLGDGSPHARPARISRSGTRAGSWTMRGSRPSSWRS